ncbi:type VI secretion system baseplate subunit TssF [Paracoccus sp. KR1-242]|uniref:type VI secretion system baseplate subunit TssF n=1 Tax=Paracoccus sp. KR1-242 TaxID=3410028 RepID=UPI003C104850
MDIRLLRHYEAELSYLREMGVEFAQSFPKIAARLGMDGTEVVDPYVERLLEGAAFLSARVQLELELQYPAFSSALCEIVYPHYLSPTPSMMIAQLVPDLANPALAEGYRVPRHSALHAELSAGQQTACQFRSAAEVTLWPIRIAEAEYIDGRGALVALGVAGAGEARAAIRLRLARADGGLIGALPIERLTLFLGGHAASGWALHELLCTETTGLVARSTDRRDDWVLPLPGGVEPRGFSPDEALLPTPRASFDGYRLLQEYFALPERFHFVDLTGLGPGLARATQDAVDIYILLRKGRADLAHGIAPDAFTLFAVPAVNLFEKRCDRVMLSERDTEHHLVPDRNAPLDHEVHSILSVAGISGEGQDNLTFRPFFSTDELTAAGSRHPAYFQINRRFRQRTEREHLAGTRTSYLGSEIWLALVDPAMAPWPPGIQQLAVRALVTNRDLPLLLGSGARNLFHMPECGPVSAVLVAVAPTRPRPSLAQGEVAWRLIGHLGLNYLSLADTAGGSGAAALRELLGLYAPLADRAVLRQIEGLVGVDTRPIVRRISDGLLSTAVRGLEIRLRMDEGAFEGAGTYVLASVLERFLRRHVTINSFTETVLETSQRGELARWTPQSGLGRVL